MYGGKGCQCGDVTMWQYANENAGGSNRTRPAWET
jgi:hypothetical protein